MTDGSPKVLCLVDTTSLYDVQQQQKALGAEVKNNINYGKLDEALEIEVARRIEEQTSLEATRRSTIPVSNTRTPGPPSVFHKKVAFVSINEKHEGQQKFCSYLRRQGFYVDITNYRDAFVHPRPSHGAANAFEGNLDNLYNYQRLSSQLTYYLGLSAAQYDQTGERTPPHVVVVSDAFDLNRPLLDYVQRRGGRATVAFFNESMDVRWTRAGLYDSKQDIDWLDLSDWSEAIVGIDLGATRKDRQGEKHKDDYYDPLA